MRDPSLHLFVDDHLLLGRWNLERLIAKPLERTSEPVLVADRPWEGGAVYLYGSVVPDASDGQFKMWYYARSGYLCYATSRDGCHWEKPALGLYEVGGSKDNNIVYMPGDPGLPLHLDSPAVMLDQAEPDPARRFKLLVCATMQTGGAQPERGLAALFSADGIHWSAHPRLVARFQGDRGHVFFDETRGVYVATNRWQHNVLQWPSEHHRRFFKRLVARSESPDFVNWSRFETILRMDDLDPEDTQFYSMYPFHYGDQYLGFLEVYHTGSQYLDTQLVSSMDGVNWHRVARREPYLERGPDGHWDYNWVCSSSNPPYVDGDRMLIWYSGRYSPHGASRPGDATGIGLFTMRRDGFAYLAAGMEGVLVTEAMRITQPRLTLNANVYSAGAVQVELLDERGEPLAGYAKDDCRPIVGDSVEHPVTWGNRDLTSLVGQEVTLRLWLHYASLYSLRFQPAG